MPWTQESSWDRSCPPEEDYRLFSCGVDAYLERYYNGHYAPAGNFFCAMAVKQAVVEWLDPRPSTYA